MKRVFCSVLRGAWLFSASVTLAQVGEPPGDPVALVIDDGTVDDIWVPILTEHYLFNRFTPSEFPIDITEISAWIPSAPQPTFPDVAIFDDDGTGPRLVATAVLISLQGDEFVSAFFDPPVRVFGPGDILIGLDNNGFPEVGIDTDTPQGRSRYCLAPLKAWQLPCDSFPIDGNWMIRAFGLVAVPVELMSFEVE